MCRGTVSELVHHWHTYRVIWSAPYRQGCSGKNILSHTLRPGVQWPA